MNGVLALYKPAGFTSFDAVAKLRGVLRERRIGHAGTLDPEATGVLVVLLGTATRACNDATDGIKVYEAELTLGQETDTQDAWGRVTAKHPVHCERAEVEAACRRFVGDILQVPPMVSAVKVNGQRLYKLARAGVEVERAARPVRIDRIELLEGAGERYRLRVQCGRGVYIRTLCADIGAALGVGGHMSALVRTRCCGFTLADAVGFEEAAAHIRPTDSLYEDLPAVTLREEGMRRACNGAPLFARDLQEPLPQGRVRVYSPEGEFVQIARYSETQEQRPALCCDIQFWQKEDETHGR